MDLQIPELPFEGVEYDDEDAENQGPVETRAREIKWEDRQKARQHRYAARKVVKAYPDLQAFARDALAMAKPAETGLARLRRALGEGREFESLRAYLPGDDIRSIDWKATAKRSAPIARQYQPERNQTVMLLLDCGRHMVSRLGARTKLAYVSMVMGVAPMVAPAIGASVLGFAPWPAIYLVLGAAGLAQFIAILMSTNHRLQFTAAARTGIAQVLITQLLQGMRVGIVVNGSVAHLVPVVIAEDDGANVQIVTGLSAADQVIQDPPDSLIEGQKVSVVTPATQTDAGGK